MTKRTWWAGALVFGVLASVLPAKGAEGWQEYDKILEKSRSIGASGPQLFGDVVDFASGSLSFAQTDLTIPGGPGLPIAITRVFQPHIANGYPDPTPRVNDGHFGDWELDLPRIEAVFATSTGWVNARADRSAYRCSVGNAAEGRSPTVFSGGNSFQGDEIWHGTRLHIPGRGAKPLLVARSDIRRPSTGGPYVWVTSEWSFVSCLAGIRNGSGEGFLATTSDGTRYWFDWMGANDESHLRKPRPATRYTSGMYDYVYRKRYGLYATRIEDRFGNWIAYSYANAAGAPVRVAGIQTSDGRSVTFTYTNSALTAVSSGSSTWSYGYSGGRLASTTLPDGSAWAFSMSGLDGPINYYTGERGENWRNCSNPGDVKPPLNPRVATVRHPSGATAEFAVGVVRFYRNVPQICSTGDPTTTNDDVAYYPFVWDSKVLVSKTITGPGVNPLTWSYGYAGGGGTTVIAPDGTSTRYQYGKVFQSDEGLLRSSTTYDREGQVVRTETNDYYLAPPPGARYPAQIGESSMVRSDHYADEHPQPLKFRRTVQGSDTFDWQAQDFDEFARPTSVVKTGRGS